AVALTSGHHVERWSGDANVTDDLGTDQLFALNAHVLLQEVYEIAGSRYAIARRWVQSECAVLAALGQLSFELHPVGRGRTVQVDAMQQTWTDCIVQRLAKLLNEIGRRNGYIAYDPVSSAAKGVACISVFIVNKKRISGDH